MADMMHKPILGVVENYSYFQCPNCGEKHYIFGKSNLEQVAADLNVKVLAQVPMDPPPPPPPRPGGRGGRGGETPWGPWPTPSWPTKASKTTSPKPHRRGETHSPRRFLILFLDSMLSSRNPCAAHTRIVRWHAAPSHAELDGLRPIKTFLNGFDQVLILEREDRLR